MKTPIRVALTLGLGLCGLSAGAITQAELDAQLQARWRDDRTGACVVAAVIEGDAVVRGRTCASERADGGPGDDAAFEIGSVSKTMLAFLVADLVAAGRWSLDDPLERHLPEAAVLPHQGERRILLRDLLAHTSGLPPLPARLRPEQPDDPYATVTERYLLDSLADVRLEQPIGSRATYSNFGMMLVSLAVTRAFGGDLEGALKERLFAPLGMAGAYLARPPTNQPQAKGHASGGRAVPHWTITPALAGVGMVRATLDDMVRYASAMTGARTGPWTERMRMTQQPLAAGFAMNWMRTSVAGHDLVLHEGGTGGFSSLVLLEPSRRKAVVVLADTALTDLGGLSRLGLSLLDPRAPTEAPRRALPVPEALKAELAGEYQLGPLTMRIWADGTRLHAQAHGQPAFELHHDSYGDLYPEEFTALLTPQREDGRIDRFLWRQGGGVLEGRRLTAARAATIALSDWAGEYELAPGFHLRVFETEGRLRVQATGQSAIDAEATGSDRLEVPVVGAMVSFLRDAWGKVTAARLTQGGKTLEGPKRR